MLFDTFCAITRTEKRTQDLWSRVACNGECYAITHSEGMLSKARTGSAFPSSPRQYRTLEVWVRSVPEHIYLRTSFAHIHSYM